MLSILLFGECRAENTHIDVQTPSQLVEVSIVDADIPNPTSLLSGQNNPGSTLSARRCLQRNGYKRTNYLFVATQGDMGVNTFSILHINILGGVVAERAFYSLCCLRI